MLNSDNEIVIRPAKGKHAIEAAAFGIEWNTPLQQQQVEAVSEIFEIEPQLARLLPNKKSLPSIKFKLESGEPEGISIQPNTGPADFSGPDSEQGETLSLSWRPEFVACSTTNYVGWRTTKPRLLEILLPFVRLALKNEGLGIQAIGLQYVDAFRWNKTHGNQLAKVIREDSAWLPKRVYSAPSFWHVHQGWFSEAPGERRVLNNVNIDFVEETEDLVIRIQGQHRVQAVKFADNSQAQGLQETDIETALDHLHGINKTVLNQILTTDTLNSIGLKLESA